MQSALIGAATALRAARAFLLLPLFALAFGAARGSPVVRTAGGGNGPAAGFWAATQDSGAKIYAVICASCHQPNGQGMGEVYPPLAGSEWVTGSPERMIRIILHGLTGEIEVQGEMYTGLMPAWGAVLKDFDVAAVATYVRASWGNRASAVAESTVTRIRKAAEGRFTPWTHAELLKIVRQE